MKPGEPLDLFPFAEPYELVNVTTGELTYEPHGFRSVLIDIAKSYGPLLAVRMQKVWTKGTLLDFCAACAELVKLGYVQEAVLLMRHWRGVVG